MSNIPTLLAGKVIDTGIRNVIKASVGLADRLHAVAVQCLLHAHVHNDVTKAERLCAGLVGVNAKGLRHWFMTYGSINFDGDGKAKVVPKTSPKFHTADGYDEKGYNLQVAVDTPYWLMADNQADQAGTVKPFKEASVIRGVFENVHKMSAALAAGKFEGDKVETAAMLKAMEAVAFKYAPAEAAAIKAEVNAKYMAKAGPAPVEGDLRPQTEQPLALTA